MTNQKTYPIKGMHCQSCEVLITEELEALPNVRKANVSLKTRTATIMGKHLPGQAEVARAVAAAGYEIGYDEKPLVSRDKRVYVDLAIGVGVVLFLVALFSKLGLGNVANASSIGASAGLVALIVGVTAGFSTCMAMIGGLVLGISARHAEQQPDATPLQKFRPHLFFNLGRIVGFTVLGGVIGALGAAFQLQGSLLGFLTLAVGLVMLLLGLQLTELFPRLRGALTLPSSIGKLVGVKKHGEREYSHKSAMLLGAATFFLPCGFTQAMQLFAVSSGNWATGALIMGLFAVGTAPGLLGIGGLTSVVTGQFAQRFFRVVGVVVVAMAFLNFSNGWNLLSLGSLSAAPATNQTAGDVADQASPTPEPEPVTLNTTFKLNSDIVPNVFTAKVGQKTTLAVEVFENGEGCMSTIMIPGLDNKAQYLKAGKTLTLTFTPKKAGTYQITCAMGVPRGKIVVEG